MKPISFAQKRCERVLNLLDSYVSNELLVETNHEVLQHLEECRACSAALQNRARTKSLLQRAVATESPAPELRDRLQSRLRNAVIEEQKPRQSWQAWPMAAAAVLVLMLGGYALVRNGTGIFSLNTEQARLSEVSEQAMRVLKIGLGDHVQCAINHRFAERSLSEQTITELLGEGYAGIANELKVNAPSGYLLTAAHKCKIDGRSFAHLILKKPDGFVSVILTRKQGESYPSKGSGKTIESFGVKLHQAQLDGFQVAGFETNQHLGFFVSGLGAQENLHIASTLAPALRNYLTKLEL
jgi:anti-sigma factor RsiW